MTVRARPSRKSGRPRVAVLAKRTSYGTFVEQGASRASSSSSRPMTRPCAECAARTTTTSRRAERSAPPLAELGAEADFYDGSRARIEGDYDLVVTVGGDGTVLGASHQLGPDVALLGVNSAPVSSVGFFCAARKGGVLPILARALAGKLAGVTLSRMRVELNDRVLHNRVLNEALFCHASPAATSRYICASSNKRAEAASANVSRKKSRSRAASGSVPPPARPPRSEAPEGTSSHSRRRRSSS